MTWIMLGTVIGTAILYANWARSRQRPPPELMENCLLTRHPLLFITGRKSIFYFLSYWNWIPVDLANHGYRVYVLDLPWRHSAERLATLQSFLRAAENRGRHFHVVGDKTCEPELLWLARQAPNSVVSATLVTEALSRPQKREPVRPEDLRPHRLPLNHVEVSVQNRFDHNLGARALLTSLHNLMIFPSTGVSPRLTGVPGAIDPHFLRQTYLQIAISLAESDLRCSH